MRTTGNAPATSTPTEAEQVYRIVSAIPPGRLCNYGKVAELAGLPGRSRWVGRLLSQLPKDSALPWFRVVNAQGRISFAVDSPGYRRQLQYLIDEGCAEDSGRIHWQRCRWP